MRFRVLVFDWDGTLMDSEALILACIGRAAEELSLGNVSRERARDVIGLGLPEALRALFPDAEEPLRARFAACYRRHFRSAAYRPGGGRTTSRFFPGVRQAVRCLREHGYLLAIATGKGRRGLQHALAATASAGLFHATRCADETASKPDPRMLVELMEELESAPHETLMIGDTEYDMAMARAAGAARAAVSYGVHATERLLAYDPVVVLDHIGQLPLWLGVRCGEVEGTGALEH